MSSNSALSLNSISKCYRLFAKPQDRLKQMIFRGRRTYFREFWALKDVSFEVAPGECIGIVGRNGAGKSTLLQIITGVIPPTSGSVRVAGKVAALLELGTGFNPEFTGRENVFLNGSILGFTQEQVREKYDDIASFADIGAFIDQPVKTYSSGMMVRLAFAVAAHVDPDILIIDEALSVGDAKFQAKCFRKFQEFRDNRKTILFVTHAVEQVIRHCDRALLIEDGSLITQGEPKQVANTYLSLLFDTKPIDKQESQVDAKPQGSEVNGLRAGSNGSASASQLDLFLSGAAGDDSFPSRPGYNRAEYRWGSREAELVDYMLCNDKQWHINHFSSEDRITLYLKVRFNRNVAKPIYGLTLKTPDGVTIYGSNSRDSAGDRIFRHQSSGAVAVVSFSLRAGLTSGHYFISLGVAEEVNDEALPLDRRYDVLEIYITNPHKVYGIADLGLKFCEIESLSPE
ncbi:MAG: ABC transporter ATP-binding protein [Deltaproteobacteria bacterium]|nr:ABC transporter ATP-binding protein [Deltaproteobacteria bacterium]